MNGTNKAIVGVVFGIALLFAALTFVCTAMSVLDGGAATIVLFAPHGGEIGIDLADVSGIEDVIGLYADFLGIFGDDKTITLALEAVGFVLAVAGMLTPWAMNVKGKENPAQYLWTQRPGATVRSIFAPWGLIGAAWSKSKPLVIVPVILLPLYALWSILLTILLIVPFLLVKAVIGGKIRSAAKRDAKSRPSKESFSVCPICKRNFEKPKVKCKCGLILDYPVPNEYGYKVHVCNNGHEMPCVAGKRSDLKTVCPYCGTEIQTREAATISIAMVGAAGAGKTTLMLASVGVITQVARGKDVTVDAVTAGVSKQTVAAKDVVARTASGELDSECIFLRSRDLPTRELIFNDISGTEFEPSEDKVLFEEYYTYSNGIVFVFDPIALIHGRGSSPMDVFESFHSMFTQINGFGPGSVSKIPFAVVASKNDILNPSLKSAEVRDFLVENGQQGFVKVVESLFQEVRYFAASSVGEDCKSAAAPVWWIVGKSDQELASKVPVLSV